MIPEPCERAVRHPPTLAAVRRALMRKAVHLLLLLLITTAVRAGGPISWSFAAVPDKDGRVNVELRARCEAGWHIYALTLPRDDGPLPTLIRVKEGPAFKTGTIQEPKAEEVEDPNFQMLVRYHDGAPVFVIPVERMSKDAFSVEGEVEYMSCNDKTCLPPQVVKFNVPIEAVH